MSELSDVGDIIGQVKAEDKDSVDTQLKVYYSILSGNEEGIFLIFFSSLFKISDIGTAEFSFSNF